ncbi:hypothetical protein AKJ37_08000, partial [candidate division MSBL1 archaeon SCGC-AAA259I09]
EFIVHSDFSGSRKFLDLGNISEAQFTPKWKQYLNNRKSHLALNWRFDVSASGTNVLAFYSKEDRVFSKMMWVPKAFGKEESKILSLWFNSSLNLLQILIERYPTRGAWLEIFKYIYEEMMVVNPDKISNNQKEKLLEIFEETREVQFPSLWKQLAMNCKRKYFSKKEIEEISKIFDEFKSVLEKDFDPRRRIDEAILSVLEIENKEKILDKLYPGLLKEIAILKRMMS